MNTDPIVERRVQTMGAGIRPRQIILFGSRASGKAASESDLDLGVVGDGEHSKQQIKLDIRRLLEPAELALDLFVLTPDELKHQKHVANTLARESTERGVAVYE